MSKGQRQTGKCVGCGFEGAIEYHHPDGKSPVVIQYRVDDEGNVTEERPPIEPYSDEWWDLLHGHTKGWIIREEHVNPDNKVPLCPLCHYLVHRWSLSIEEAGALVLGYWKAKFGVDDHRA